MDGISHAINDATGLGFRDANAWLAMLTGNGLAPTFYAGDAVGSFNWWLRLLTGLLAGSATAWVIYPHLDDAFSDIRRTLEVKLRRVVR